jgi:hypothetical protein
MQMPVLEKVNESHKVACHRKEDIERLVQDRYGKS